MPRKMKEMTYEELMSLYRQEKQKVLAKVPFDLYERLAAYLEALNERCSLDGGGEGEMAGMLKSQLRTAQQKAAEMYESRMRKIVLMALNSAFGAEPRLENATEEERGAFDRLKEFFIEHRDRTLTRCEKGREASSAVGTGESESGAEESRGGDEEAEPKGAPEKAPGPSAPERAGKDSVIIRVIEDLPAFAGSDRNYLLSKEDVISLPRNIADILVRNKKAAEIKHSVQ